MIRTGSKLTKVTGGVISALMLFIALSAEGVMAQQASGESSTAPDFSDWTCERCPEPEYGWSVLAEFGLGWISEGSLRYGSYRGLEDEGAYLPLDGEGKYRDSQGRYVNFSAKDLALDNREVEIEGGREGRYTLNLSLNEIPIYRGYGAQTPFQGQGSTSLTLPSDWVDGRTTGEMTALQSSLNPAPMKLQRKTLNLGGTFRLSGNWSIDVDAQRQDKSGTRPFGGAGVFYNNASQILAPVDFTTDRVDVGINWSRKTFQLIFGFSASEFDNNRNSLTWENPFTGPPQTDNFRAALEPSNEFYQFSLTGAWTIRPGMNLSGYASMGEMSQDEAFLPYSINPEFDGLTLPRTSLDGKVDTSVANLGGKFFARINSRLSINARAKYDERDNQTPVDVYTPVNSDFIIFGPRTNRPYGFERRQYSADVRFRAFRKLRLSGGGRYQEIDRTFQSIEEADESTWWAEAKFTPVSRTHVRATFEQSSRDTSEYQPVTDSGRVDHPLFRKYNQADRDRNKGNLEAFYATTNGLGLNLTVYGAEDEYEESVLGLQSSEVRGATLSMDYVINEKSSVYAFVSGEEIESELFGMSDSLAWVGSTDDQISTAGAGYSIMIDENRKLGVDLVWADSEGDIDVTTNGPSPFPTLKTTLKNVRLHFSHSLNDKWGYRLYAEFESFDSSDWAFDGIGVDGVDAVLTYGIISPHYNVLNLRAQATYRF
ncbi:MAG TPA: MtrB/PioB family decaheme-associated outer membrane protein [Xanthomonadales bacterium]|nr:MtrB/PioB family decaheme-associated outer membrane protein [Xanthomonadales bacterium]